MTKPYSIADTITSTWNGRVPIILGVTGHRDIDMESPELKTAIRSQCAALKKTYPNTPFVILSGMAEGADRLVTSIAMDELDAALAAVLPMPRAEFEKDFDTPASRTEFAQLLARAFSISVVTTPAGENWKTPGDARNRQYSCAGAIIVDHAQILFAVWDQTRPVLPGGTGDVVSWFLRGYSPPNFSTYETALSPLDPPKPGRLITIDPYDGAVSFIDERERGNSAKPNRRSPCGVILREIEIYNRDAVTNPDAVAISKRHPLLPKDSVSGPAFKFIESAYSTADGLSVKYADRVRSAELTIYWMAMLAVVAFNLIDKHPVSSWVYLGITLLMAALWGAIAMKRTDNRFMEYRSLAEAMRIMYFWQVAGVDKTLWLAYLSRHSGVVHWIRHAVRTLEFCRNCLVPRPLTIGHAERAAHIELVRQHWIKCQADWFNRKREQHHQYYSNGKRLGRVALLGSFLVAGTLAVMAVLGLVYSEGTTLILWGSPLDQYSNWLQIVLGVLAAIGLAARGYVTRRADLELVKQYASQREIFVIALRTLDSSTESGDLYWNAERVLQDLGEKALQEQAEWLWLRHSRPFEVPS